MRVTGQGMTGIESDAHLATTLDTGDQAIFAETLAAGIADAQMSAELFASWAAHRTVGAD